MLLRTFCAMTLLAAFSCGPASAAEEPLFPFVVSYDAPANATNVGDWLEKPAGKSGFVSVKDGRLVVGSGGRQRPIRFWATNLCFEACFPTHEQAERVAARLARLGINCVRMHHMDNRSIWGNSPDKTIVDPEKLERLDYLIAQLKRHGIYTNINLHVSRWLDEKEGFPHRQQRPNYDKGLDNFEPRMIELQRKYARDLLAHVNPYTNSAYTDEPAVAFVEINNENALFADWGKLDDLPDPYAATYRKLWNAWLRKKYGDGERLRKAWNVVDRPLGAELLKDDGVPVPRRSEMTATEPARADFADFLWETERDYWLGMYRFLKDELKVKPLVAGTQLGWSPVHVQANLDFIDAHSYWHHPRFPGRPWDPANWTVRNEALVNGPGGTVAGLANRRVAGMAYTVSEYNHPEPNQYAAEGFPMIAALGAFQGWDAVYSFAYCHNSDFEPRRIGSYFDIKSVAPRLVHMPACAAMFLRGDVAEAKKTIVVPLSLEAERAQLRQDLSARRLAASDLGLDGRYALLHGVGVDAGKAKLAASQTLPPALPKDAAQFRSDTGELLWDVAEKNAGYFQVDTPRSKLFTGFVRSRTFDLGNVKLKIGPTRLDWATVSLVCLDGAGFDRPGRILIAATGLVQNTDANLQQLPGGNVTLGNKWGSEPVLCEGVPAEITLPVAAERVQIFPLDESGNRRELLAATVTQSKAMVVLDAKHKTVWYEAVVK